MSLTLYHLHFSQCDRIIWLCEELTALIPDFKYDLKVFPRGLEDSIGKQTLLSLHPAGTSPTLVDTLVSPPVTMAESQAILTYIINVHGKGHFDVPPSAGPQAYSRYLYWMSFANSSFQASLAVNLVVHSIFAAYSLDPADIETNMQLFAVKHSANRTTGHLNQYESQLSRTRYLAGDEFTAADFMNVYALTTFRTIYPVDLTPYPCLRRYLREITAREGYKRMMAVAEDGMPAMVEGVVPRFSVEVLMSYKGWRDVMDEEGRAL